MTETDNKTRYGRIAVILIALAIVIAALVSFIAMNNERIYEQNTKYLQGSTEQSARRISEWMTDSQTEIKLLSSMYESTLASVDEISAAGIEQLANYTKFDYTTISLSDGLTIDDKGQEADASDREYFGILNPIFNGMSPFVMFAVMLAVCLVLTNFANNGVIALLLLSIVYITTASMNIPNIGYFVSMLAFASQIAFLIPGSSLYGAMIHGNDWVSAGFVYKTTICVVILVFLIFLAFWPVSLMLY